MYDIKFTNVRNIEYINVTVADKQMNLYGLHKKLKIARRNVYIFNQINKLKNIIQVHQI